MKKKVIGSVSVFAVLVGLGIAWWLISPLFLNETVNEELPTEEQRETSETGQSEESEKETDSDTPVVTLAGTFNGTEKYDAEGEARTLESEGKTYVRFENFEITNGPDLVVSYLKGDEDYKSGTKLGNLKGNVGDQNYELPSDLVLEPGDRVVVWCRAFDVEFGTAVLQ